MGARQRIKFNEGRVVQTVLQELREIADLLFVKSESRGEGRSARIRESRIERGGCAGRRVLRPACH